MGQRLVEGKKDADKSQAELIAELNALRGLNSRLKDVVKRYEKVAGKKDLYRNLYDLEADKESVESLQIELQEKQKEIDIHGEELGVRNEEMRAQLEEINALNDVARINAALRESSEMLRVAQQVAHIGTFEWNIRTGVNTWTPELEAMYGLPSGGFPGTEDAWEQLVHPEDRLEVVRRVNEAMDKGGLEGEWRVVWPDGTVHWLYGRAFVFKDDSGKPLKLIGINIDITERKQMEEGLHRSRDVLEQRVRERTAELSESEERFRQLADNSPIPMAINDKDDNITYLNKKYIEIFGYTLEDIPHLSSWWPLAYPDPEYREEAIKRWEKGVEEAVRESKDIGPIDYIVTCKDGSVRYTEISGVPIGDKELVLLQDVTERKRAEQKLRKNQQLLRSIVDGTSDAIFLKDLHGRYLLFNSAAEGFTGKKASDVIGKDDTFLFSPDEAKALMDVDRAVMDSGKQQTFEEKVTDSSGKQLTLLSTKGPLFDEGGNITGIFGIARDITERKRAEEAMRVSEANLARAQRITRLGNWTWDVKCDRVVGSTEFFRMFGFGNRQYIVYDEFIARLHPDDREPVDRAVQATLSGTMPYSIDYRVVLHDGVEQVIHAEGEVTRDYSGQPVTMFGTVQDVTERRRAEKELEEAKARAELYLDLMGHDINNMNQSALGFLELALQTLDLDGKIGPDGRVLIEKPLQAVQSSSRLISNVRKLQRLADEGVKTRPIDLHDLFEGLKSHDVHASDKDATINVHEVPHYLVKGSDLLRDVFFNLISNAVKHSEPDMPVTIDVGVERVDQNGRAYYRCTVEDNGPGVPDSLKSKLFHRFQRGKTQAHGKGLGLYLVRTLVEGYHGKVWVEDRVPGDHTKGARFVVMLPAIAQ